jgi:hypothetical protein
VEKAARSKHDAHGEHLPRCPRFLENIKLQVSMVIASNLGNLLFHSLQRVCHRDFGKLPFHRGSAASAASFVGFRANISTGQIHVVLNGDLGELGAVIVYEALSLHTDNSFIGRNPLLRDVEDLIDVDQAGVFESIIASTIS